MIRQFKIVPIVSFFALLILAAVIMPANAQDYKSLEGINGVNTIFDFRDSTPASALGHLSLVHKTYKDKAIRSIEAAPEFVVVFMGQSVKLLSSDRKEFSEKERNTLKKMDNVISAMAEDGIRLEVCLVAVSSFGVAPESIAPEIDRVPNGWISSLGYQANGYALIPVF